MRKYSGTLRTAGPAHIETSLPFGLERAEAFCDRKGAQSLNFFGGTVSCVLWDDPYLSPAP